MVSDINESLLDRLEAAVEQRCEVERERDQWRAKAKLLADANSELRRRLGEQIKPLEGEISEIPGN